LAADFNENSGKATMSPTDSNSERRRYDRIALGLHGRYMLADGKEFECDIVDVSPVGVAIRGPLAGDLGERVIVYVEELGRLSGVVVRRSASDDWFAIELRVPAYKINKLAMRIDWLARRLAEGLPERRRSARFDRDQEQTTLSLPDGRQLQANLLDVSAGGAALEVDVKPPVGASVSVGQRRGRVSRHFAGGIAVKFDQDGT